MIPSILIEPAPKKVDKFLIVKYQMMHHCFLNNIRINETELNILSFLGELGKIRMTLFCIKAAEKKYLSTPQAVNTCLGKLSRSNLFMKEGVGKKIIFLNPELQIHAEGNIVFNVKLIKIDSNYVPRNSSENGKKVTTA